MNKYSNILTQKVKIGISACCMGCPVRYNGKGYDVTAVLEREKSDFIWNPVCPECMAGLGVPRDPIHIAGESGSKVWEGEASIRGRSGRDVTQQMKNSCNVCLNTLKTAGVKVYIYMDGSPSCGVYRTTLKKQSRGKPPGVFGSLLFDNGMFLIPSTDLQSPVKWWDWRRRMLAFVWLFDLEILSAKDVYEVWHNLKFLCQELDEPWSRQMGKTLADASTVFNNEFIESFRQNILELLRKPSNLRRITNSLWKHYSHYKKKSGKELSEINTPDAKRNVTTIAKELLLLERKSFEDGVLFGASPILYRDKRRVDNSVV